MGFIPTGTSCSQTFHKFSQVKRQKPGQAAAVALPLPKVLPLTKTTSGKMAAAAPAPTPAKIKLMSRPQVCAVACAASSLMTIKNFQVYTCFFTLMVLQDQALLGRQLSWGKHFVLSNSTHPV